MHRFAYLTAASIFLGTAASAVALASDPDPFSTGPAVVLAGSALVFGLACVVGLLLSRGRWATYLSGAVVTVGLALAIADGFGPTAVVAVGLYALGAGLLAGPWMTGWLRRRASATGPPPAAVVLLAAAAALVPGTAVASPDALDWQQGAMVAAAAVAAVAYSRASVAALWWLRLGLLPFSLLAVAASPVWGGLYLAAHTAAVTGLAWSEEATLAARPLIERYYGPRSARPLQKKDDQ